MDHTVGPLSARGVGLCGEIIKMPLVSRRPSTVERCERFHPTDFDRYISLIPIDHFNVFVTDSPGLTRLILLPGLHPSPTSSPLASPLSLLASLHSFLSISPPRNSPFNAEDLRKTRYHARFSATKERSLCLTLCVLSFYERHTRVTLNMTRGKALSFSLRVLEKNKVSARSQGN